MKKLGVLLALWMSISASHASVIGWMDSCFDLTDGGQNAPGCTLFLLGFTTFAPVAAPALTTSAGITPEDKLAYENEIREESAEYIAADGAAPAGAVLEDAILAARAMSPSAEKQTDLQIARSLLQ